MNLHDYYLEIKRFIHWPEENEYDYLRHGLFSEVGEYLGLYAKELRGDSFSSERYLDELSDILFFVAVIAVKNGLALSSNLYENSLVVEISTLVRRASQLFEYKNMNEIQLVYALNDILRYIHWQVGVQNAMTYNIEKLTERYNRGDIRSDTRNS